MIGKKNTRRLAERGLTSASARHKSSKISKKPWNAAGTTEKASVCELNIQQVQGSSSDEIESLLEEARKDKYITLGISFCEKSGAAAACKGVEAGV